MNREIIVGRRVLVIGSGGREHALGWKLAQSDEVGVTGIRSDVSVLDDITSMYSEIKEKFGNIDVLFLNAGIAPFTPLEHTSEEHFDSIMNINVKGLFFGVQKALPLLNDNASIILTSSIANQLGWPGTTVYGASKAAVRSFARSMSAELKDKGIRVNIVSPGPIETPIFSKTGMSDEQLEGMKNEITKTHPMKRFGKPEEIAAAALFLASKDSSYIMGAEIIVDGGMTQL